MRKQLDRSKASASTEDRVEVRPGKESLKVSGPFLSIARQIAFAVMYCGSKLDLEPFLPHSLNPGKQAFIIEAASGCHNADFSAPS
jgi:hypothetical protein